jgi:hypothetical protein
MLLEHNTEVEFNGFWRNNDKVILRPFVYHLRYLSSFFAKWLHPVGRASAPPLDIGWVTNGKWFFCYLSGNWFLMSCCCLLKRHKELFLKRLKRYIERILKEPFAVLTWLNLNVFIPGNVFICTCPRTSIGKSANN